MQTSLKRKLDFWRKIIIDSNIVIVGAKVRIYSYSMTGVKSDQLEPIAQTITYVYENENELVELNSRTTIHISWIQVVEVPEETLRRWLKIPKKMRKGARLRCWTKDFDIRSVRSIGKPIKMPIERKIWKNYSGEKSKTQNTSC